MKNLREAFISRDFIINSNIIKCINKLDINLDEFLLLLYFINYETSLDVDDIKSKLGFDDDKVFSVYSSLVDKKYIDMIVSKKGSEVEERISLEPFYDKLALNNEVENNNSDIFALFEKELGRTLSSYEYEIMNGWIEKGISEELITDALKEAILNGVTGFKYIDKIVYEWNKKGYKKGKKIASEELFDYDWLNNEE